jgi:hypothetical protein
MFITGAIGESSAAYRDNLLSRDVAGETLIPSTRTRTPTLRTAGRARVGNDGAHCRVQNVHMGCP